MAAKHPHINDLIRTAMKVEGVRAPELADKLGISAPTVYRWLSGDNTPDESMWPILEAELNISLSRAPEHTYPWAADISELRTRVDDLESRLASLEAGMAPPLLRAAQGPTAAHRTVSTVRAKGPRPAPADPDDHHT